MPYTWEVSEDTIKISVSYGPLDATFEGKFSEDGKCFGGGWRPNRARTRSINVPYDIMGHRVK
jgi:hypothetical protein